MLQYIGHNYCLTPLALPHHGRVESVLHPATQGENIQNWTWKLCLTLVFPAYNLKSSYHKGATAEPGTFSNLERPFEHQKQWSIFFGSNVFYSVVVIFSLFLSILTGRHHFFPLFLHHACTIKPRHWNTHHTCTWFFFRFRLRFPVWKKPVVHINSRSNAGKTKTHTLSRKIYITFSLSSFKFDFFRQFATFFIEMGESGGGYKRTFLL